MSELTIPKDLLQEMLDHCVACFPNEACGILAGAECRVSRVYLMVNHDPSPVSYLMDPREQLRVQKKMRGNSERMVAIFHSHPRSPAYPSAKDVRMAFYDDAVYVIVGLVEGAVSEIRAFTIVEGAVTEVRIIIGN
jgi:proteasome lid subunit RPN8/RPN11